MGKPTAYNTAYTAHFVRPNFGFAETSYMLGTLDERLGLEVIASLPCWLNKDVIKHG
jgi:hypothetical protein